jgi:hypothetical protein
MTTELFLFIILVLILLYFLPERKHTFKNRIEKRYKRRQNKSSDSGVSNEPAESESTESTDSEDSTNQTSEQVQDVNYDETHHKLNKYKTHNKSKKISMEVINDYLSETKCEEGFDTMGPDMSIGNDMAFQAQPILPKTKLDKALSKSLVPDFEPNSLNINPDLNSFGYATNNPEDNNFYASRGYINPMDASQFANSVQYNLAYPYQTRYCKN